MNYARKGAAALLAVFLFAMIQKEPSHALIIGTGVGITLAYEVDDRINGLSAIAADSLSPGEKKFHEACTVCHGVRDPQIYTQDEWRSIASIMFEWGNVAEEDRKLILDFLLENASDAH